MLTGTSVATTNMATSARIEISSGDIATSADAAGLDPRASESVS